ncbi:MAG: efflux RND transporter permease subunit [Pseudolabrys sp.]|nr:efflux RND transporter permease subunit [Pseudolabrys sp.]
MNISEFCIRHPVATTLMSAALVAGGLFAYLFLPVAALPRTEFPVINVSASLSGASPDTMANSVATPLIKQFSTIAGIDTISASSSQGSTSIALQFDLNRDIDSAAADVQSAIARVQRQLPSEMTDPPSFRKVNPADAPILILALSSEIAPLPDLDAFAQQVISPELSTLPGVAQVQVFGSQKYAVRVRLNPDALAARGIGVDEVQTAIAAANANTPVGTLRNAQQSLTIQAQTELTNADQFRSIIVATRGDRPVRLGDLAEVTDSVENIQTASRYNGTRAIILGVYRQPEANTVEVVDRIRALLPNFEDQLPRAAELNILNDRSTSVRAAVHDVQLTLMLIVGLVILVIFLFLRRVSATVIPAVAVPISLIATLGAMYLFGFSINNISLLGLTLAVGLVVDDAIVMLENIHRHIEKGLTPFEAAVKGSREITFTIISTTASLVAVFIPVLLMGGIIGRIFNEFAVVVTTAIVASTFVSLTLSPMMAARMLRPSSEQKEPGRWSKYFERGFDAMLRGYDHSLQASLRHKPWMLVVFAVTLAGTAWLLVTTPKGLFPQEDIGQLSVSTEARQDISFEAMGVLQAQVEAAVRSSPHVANVASIVGGNALNAGRMFVELKPRGERGDMQTVLADLRRATGSIPGIRTFATPVQNLRIGGRASRAEYQFVVQGLNRSQLYEWSQKMADGMGRDPSFADVNSDLQINATQATLVVDRDKAASLGISAGQLRSTLYSGFGSRQVSTIYGTGDSFSVIMEFNDKANWTTASIPDVRIRNSDGKLVPIGAFARVDRTAGSLTINQLGQLPAVTLSFNLPAGVSLGEAVARIDQLKEEQKFPSTLTTAFAGSAQTYQDSVANQGILLLGALVTIYIVLGILYESYIHPFTILTGLPSAVIGALIALRLFGMDLSLIAVVGLLMLMGIVKKNAIMMIDVALVTQREGKPPADAIYEAAILRFRPIMMTTLTALLGVLPIAIGIGAGAELRQPLGVALVGGLFVSQLVTLYLTPALYIYMEQLSAGTRRLYRRVLGRPPVPVADI